MGRSTAVMALVLGGLLASGCLVPFAVPPLKGSAATGAAGGNLPAAGMGPTAPGTEMIAEFRGAMHPLQIDEDLQNRRWDLGIGYLLQMPTADGFDGLERHGPFLEVGYRVWHRPLGDRQLARMTVHVGGELILADDGLGTELGGGGSLGATLELVTWASGPFAASDDGGIIVGGAEGESSVGLVGSTSYRSVAGSEYWLLTLGITLRTPALAGLVLFIPRS